MTRIEWADMTWSPITGCTPVSEKHKFLSEYDGVEAGIKKPRKTYCILCGKKKTDKIHRLRTPDHQIRSALRKLWLRSVERSRALKRDNYTCQGCGKKQSRAKGKEFSVEVHHKDGIDRWNEITELIKGTLLQDPEKLETLCKKCHKEEGAK